LVKTLTQKVGVFYCSEVAAGCAAVRDFVWHSVNPIESMVLVSQPKSNLVAAVAQLVFLEHITSFLLRGPVIHQIVWQEK